MREGHPGKTNDKRKINKDAYPFKGEPNMAFNIIKNQLGKQLDPRIDSADLPDLLELDMATAQALNNHQNGLSPSLRSVADQPSDLPEYFQLFDLRKPADVYVQDKLEGLLKDIFEVRRKVEKTLSRNELIAYDKVLASHLTKEALLPRLREACENDRNHLQQLKQLSSMKREGQENE